MRTPWGTADYIEEYEPGIWWVSTPEHGGLRLSREYAAKHLSPAAIAEAEEYAGYLWYEEDLAWAIPAFELLHLKHKFFPNEYTPAMGYLSAYDYLLEILQREFPEYYTLVGKEG